MDFSKALSKIKNGARMRRAGWNGKGMWVVLITHNWSGTLKAKDDMPAEWQGYLAFVAMYTADKKLVPWLASQTDILATDWEDAS